MVFASKTLNLEGMSLYLHCLLQNLEFSMLLVNECIFEFERQIQESAEVFTSCNSLGKLLHIFNP